MYSSPYFRQDLLGLAEQASDKETWVSHDEDLAALARLDWTLAEQLLIRLSQQAGTRTQATALAYLYEGELRRGDAAKVVRYRTQLQAIVQNRQAFGQARDKAAEALLTSKWEGWREWYTGLFADPALRDLKDGSTVYNPLCHPVAAAPDYFIPLLTSVLDSANGPKHDAAVTCLVMFHLKDARRDALVPLLPWLNNPKWSAARDRLRLIQSMDFLDVPESVPGLIAVLDQDDSFDRSYAAEALVRYRPASAAPALKRALAREPEWAHRRRIFQALFACGGVSDSEAVESLVALSRELNRPGGEARVQQSSFGAPALSLPVALGLFLSEREVPPKEAIIERALRRAALLQGTEPKLANRIRALFDHWPSAAADRNLVQRLAAGQLDVEGITSALSKAAPLQKTVARELCDVAGGTGMSAGVAAILCPSTEHAARILITTDQAAQAGLLASARLLRRPLELDRVASLLRASSGVVRDAGIEYLLALDTTAARDLYYSLHPHQAMIAGRRSAYDAGHATFSAFEDVEQRLRAQVLSADGPDEVLALADAGYWRRPGLIHIEIRNQDAKLVYETNAGRSYERLLSTDEIASLREFLAASHVDQLGPFDTGTADGVQLEFLRLSRQGGYRVYMKNPGFDGAGPYEELCKRFRDLVPAKPMQVRYRGSTSIPGFQVLLAEEGAPILAVWKVESDFLVLAGARPRASGRVSVAVPDEGRVAATVSMSSSAASEPQWRRWTAAGGPAESPFDIAQSSAVPEGFSEIGDNPHPWNLVNRKGERFAAGALKDHRGLWRIAPNGEAKLLIEGNVALPLMSSSEEWIVFAQTDTDWAKPNYVVRLHLLSAVSNGWRCLPPTHSHLSPL